MTTTIYAVTVASGIVYMNAVAKLLGVKNATDVSESDLKVAAAEVMKGKASIHEILKAAKKNYKQADHHAAVSLLPVATSSPVIQPVLRGVSGPFAGSVVELDDRPLAIGRDPRLCQLVMPPTATDIGRCHCIVQYHAETGGFTLEDCWSSNGTFIDDDSGDGQPIESGCKHPL